MTGSPAAANLHSELLYLSPPAGFQQGSLSKLAKTPAKPTSFFESAQQYKCLVHSRPHPPTPPSSSLSHGNLKALRATDCLSVILDRSGWPRKRRGPSESCSKMPLLGWKVSIIHFEHIMAGASVRNVPLKMCKSASTLLCIVCVCVRGLKPLKSENGF